MRHPVTLRGERGTRSERGRSRLGWFALAGVGFAVGAVLAASPAIAHTLDASTASTKVIGNPVAGKLIFETAGCKGCHTLKAAGATGTVGPNLDQLKPAYATIVHQVTNGGDYMPAFAGKLSAKQIEDVAAFVYDATHAAAASSGVTTKVTVLAGRPTEFSFTLSRKTVPLGTVVFTIENKGKTKHAFKVCSSPKGGRADACAGRGTAPIAPGKTAKLTIKFTKKGTYEYLCTIKGHAAAGMKGDLKVT
jgi:mono/diheme cytochrome c family protein